MRITLTQEELALISEIANLPRVDNVEAVTYTVNQSLTVEVNRSGVSIMRGTTSQTHSIYAPGTK